MNVYLHYCQKCNSLFGFKTQNGQMSCTKCGNMTITLNILQDEWNEMSNAEKKKVLTDAISLGANEETAPSRQRTESYEDDYSQVRRNSKRYIEDDFEDDDYSSGRYDSYRRTNQRDVSRRERYDDFEDDDYQPRRPRSRKDDYYDEDDYYDGPEGKFSGMSIAAFVCSFFSCVGIVGLILGIIDLTKKDGRKKGLSIAAVVIASIMLILSTVFFSTFDSDKKEEKSITSVSNDSGSTQVDVTNTVNDTNSTDAPASVAGPSYTIDEQVLVDKAGIKITATEYTTDSVWGDGIKMLIENNTQQTVMVGCTALIVNDYMISDLFSSQIAAGKQSYETLYLSNSQLRQAGIDNVGKVEIYFHAYDDATWDDLFRDEYVCLETSDSNNMDSTTNIDGQEIYNQNGIRLVAQYVNENDFWGTAVLIYAENNSSDNIHISIDDVSVNDLMVSAMYSSTVYAGKKSFDDITIFSSSLEENGITDVNNIEFAFKIYNEDTYDTIVESEPIKLTLN